MINTILEEVIDLCVKVPFLAPVLFGILFIMTLDTQYLILFGLVIVNEIINPLLKLIMKFIYRKSGRTTLPILGLGYRPNVGKVHCGIFKPTNHKSGSKTFGMPSGHSQIIWSLIAYGLMVLYNKHKNDDDFLILYSIRCAVLIVIGLLVSLSRVYMGCHTIRQVLIGGIIGAGIGVGTYYLYPNPPVLV